VPRVRFIHPFCREVDPEPTRLFMAGLRHKRVVVLVRDPRRVVVTYYFRLRKRMRDPVALDMDLSTFIRDETLGIRRIVAFMNTWHGAGKAVGALLFLHFEDLRDRPREEFPRLLTFLGIAVDLELLEAVLRDVPDVTTVAIEDDSAYPTPADLAYMEQALRDLDPAIGYQVGDQKTENNETPST
jgi:hypothetical protein